MCGDVDYAIIIYEAVISDLGLQAPIALQKTTHQIH